MKKRPDIISVPKSLRLRTVMMERFKSLYKLLGDLETWTVKTELAGVNIVKPVYVTSLARSGTTIVSEMLSQHESTSNHCYGDFPGLFTPYWKNWIKQRQVIGAGTVIERAHQDRIEINNNSIEAFEEVFWMYFFDSIHQNGMAYSVSYHADNAFNSYYIEHIKKLLLIKGGNRYLAKANYNSNRIEYILALFPDAKFVVPIRHPINHIASLNKQHGMFLLAASKNKSIDLQLATSGHFEFGNLREVIRFADKDRASHIKNLFEQAQELTGWAEYWLYFYQSIRALKQKSAQLNEAIKIIRYEDLCVNSSDSIDEILSHCELDHSNSHELKAKYVKHLSPPDYYEASFSQQQISNIMKITIPLAKEFGYDSENYF